MAIINQVVSGGGSPAPSGKYQLLQRVTDDSNNEIGTVCGFHLDANNVEYAIVALDAAYRVMNVSVMSSEAYPSAADMYRFADVYGERATATSNCDLVLARCQQYGVTSGAVGHCRAQTFTIGGVQYAGQLPNMMELLKIYEYREEINTVDPTASANPNLIINISGQSVWSSTQYDAGSNWGIASLTGRPFYTGRSTSQYAFPILEIPMS